MKVILASRATCLDMLQRELAMNESFIQVENQGLASSMLGHLTVNDCVLGGDWGLTEATCLGELIQLLLGEVQLLLQVCVVSLGSDPSLLLWDSLVLNGWWLLLLLGRAYILASTRHVPLPSRHLHSILILIGLHFDFTCIDYMAVSILVYFTFDQRLLNLFFTPFCRKPEKHYLWGWEATL